MKSFSFTTEIDPEREPCVKRLTNNSNETITAYGFSGPYFQPNAVEVKELARDTQNRLIDEGILDPTLDPPLQNMIREVLENFFAKQFYVNLERART